MKWHQPGVVVPLRALAVVSISEQGSYASGKGQGNLIFFKVRELSGKHEILSKYQGIVREFYISVM